MKLLLDVLYFSTVYRDAAVVWLDSNNACMYLASCAAPFESSGMMANWSNKVQDKLKCGVHVSSLHSGKACSEILQSLDLKKQVDQQPALTLTEDKCACLWGTDMNSGKHTDSKWEAIAACC